MPVIDGTSSGDGRKSTTASSSGCTPLFLNADPQMTGTNAASPLPRTELLHALAERRLDLVLGDLLAVQVFLEDLVVGFADLLDQLLAVVLRLVQHVGRNLADDVVGAHRLVLVGDRLHLDEVDHADELVFRADGQLNRDRVGFELAR